MAVSQRKIIVVVVGVLGAFLVCGAIVVGVAVGVATSVRCCPDLPTVTADSEIVVDSGQLFAVQVVATAGDDWQVADVDGGRLASSTVPRDLAAGEHQTLTFEIRPTADKGTVRLTETRSGAERLVPFVATGS